MDILQRFNFSLQKREKNSITIETKGKYKYFDYVSDFLTLQMESSFDFLLLCLYFVKLLLSKK